MTRDLSPPSPMQPTSGTPRVSTSVWRAPEDGEVVLFRGEFRDTRFPPHFHEHYVVGVTEEGVYDAWCGRRRYDHFGTDRVVVIPPGEMHTGETVAGVRWVWRAFYPSAAWVERLVADLEGHAGGDVLGVGDWADAPIAARLLAAHRAFERRSGLAGAELLVEALTAAVARRQPVRAVADLGREPAAVRAAREYLHEHLADAVALDELCTVAGMTPFRLVRAFRRAYGVPPHRYQLGLRVARAKELMRCGRELVDVAGEVGFYDQSHLARHFKRHTGVTPRAYALAVGPPPRRRS